MKLRKILSNLRLIDDSVDQLEKKTDSLYQDFESIEDCESPKCQEEKIRLKKEMGSCLNKLRYEEKILDDCEDTFHACSGQFI